MCRHAAYLGPAIPLSGLMRTPAHSLEHQAYAPRELLVGTVCADGYGIGWYDETAEQAARYASPLPVWADANLSGFGDVVRSRFIMGAVRNATVAGTTSEANCAPFADGLHLLSLNGYLDDFDASWKQPVLEQIPAVRRASIKGSTDAEHILQAILGALDRDPKIGLAGAVGEVVRALLDVGASLGKDAQLALLVSDGDVLVATRAGNMAAQNSLYHLNDGRDWPGAHVVSSEPMDADEGWHDVPQDSLLVLSHGAPPVILRV